MKFTQEEIGYCDSCGSPLALAEPFEREYIEEDGEFRGRYCHDYGYIVCKSCLKKFAIDDSFAGKPYYKHKF